IPEVPILYDELTLYEHLRLTAMAYNLSEETFEKRLQPLLKEFRMEKRLKWFPVHFSKGMRQKVMIMCAFLIDRKSTRLNSSHVSISYAVFCLKKKKIKDKNKLCTITQ